MKQLCVVVHICNLSTQKVEARELVIQAYCQIRSEGYPRTSLEKIKIRQKSDRVFLSFLCPIKNI